PHDPGRAAPAPDERCRRPRHRPDRADRPGRPARPRPCRQASATLCVAEDSDRRASRPSSGVVLSVSEPIPPTGGWCTSCPCRTASTCGCTCATTHRDSMIFQAKISTTISHYFAEPRAAFQLPQAISKACHGPHLPHRQKSPLKNGSWASSDNWRYDPVTDREFYGRFQERPADGDLRPVRHDGGWGVSRWKWSAALSLLLQQPNHLPAQRPAGRSWDLQHLWT